MEKQPILRISDGLSTSYLFSMMTTKMAGVFLPKTIWGIHVEP
jgi:hypothetical protein